jgi:hypothetical protein
VYIKIIGSVWRYQREVITICISKKNRPQALGYTVIFIISLKLNIFPFSASILTFSTQNHLILMYFTHFDTTHFFYEYFHFDTTHFFYKYLHFDTTHFFYKCWYYSIYRKKWVVSKCVKYVKIRWFCIEKVRIEALKGKIFNINEITKITECTRVPVEQTTQWPKKEDKQWSTKHTMYI